MKIIHIFILNPAAGYTDRTAELRTMIDTVCRHEGLEYVILNTLYKGHAALLCADFAREHSDSICRFYSCGGDGTLNEIVTGVMDSENSQVACFACGTGNDFVKIFSNPSYFGDMTRIISGDTQYIDMMEVKTDDKRFGALNICSAGIDARVADWAGRNKRRIPLKGKLVYDISLVKAFFGKISRYYRVSIDGKRLDGDYTILVAASGRYYGGGYYAVPEAEPDDGLLDFLLVKKVGHISLLQLINKYQTGHHTDLVESVYMRGRSIRLESVQDEPVNYDGEIAVCRSAEISLHSRKVAFIVPNGCKIIHGARAYERIHEQKRVKARKHG